MVSGFIRKMQPSLEAQLVNFADEIAYNHHDIDDGFRSGLLTFEQLQDVSVFSMKYVQNVKSESPLINDRQSIRATIRRMMNFFIMDLCEQSQSPRIDKQRTLIQLVMFVTQDKIIALSEDMSEKQQIFEAIFKRSALSAPSSAGYDRQRL